MKRSFILNVLLVLLSPAASQAYQPAVVSAHPEATRVGIAILKKGGSAADAAIATAFALSVVEPHNSGIGGGGFLLYYEAKKKNFSFVDYRETAPIKISKKTFAADPQLLERGILSVGVPGFLMGMETIHKRWRRVSWPAVIEPAIELAKKGVFVSGSLSDKISENRELLNQDPETARIFLERVGLLGTQLDFSDLAKTLEDIKTGGSAVFYRKELAQKLTRFFKTRGGLITSRDLSNYRAHFRRPHEFDYGKYRIVSAPAPSSGGAGLDLLFKKTIINNLTTYPAFSGAAYEILLQGIRDYFDYRDVALGDTTTNILAHTTHLCVIDAEGNIAAMTNTLNYPFGSGLVVPGTGIVLNNEMNDFSMEKITANKIAPGKRPLSSMAPTIVMKNRIPSLVIGTPGGKTIPQNLYQILFLHWEWQLPFTRAIAYPKIYYTPSGNKVLAEKKLSKRIIERLKGNYSIERSDKIGNVQALVIENEKRTRTYSDPRGEGKGHTLTCISHKIPEPIVRNALF